MFLCRKTSFSRRERARPGDLLVTVRVSNRREGNAVERLQGRGDICGSSAVRRGAGADGAADPRGAAAQPVLRLVRSHALTSLETAHEVTFIGHSFPTTDMAAWPKFSRCRWPSVGGKSMFCNSALVNVSGVAPFRLRWDRASVTAWVVIFRKIAT